MRDLGIEKGVLRLTIAVAEGFAREGELGAGFTYLVSGFHEALQVDDRGESWSAVLAASYDEAIEDYTRRYRVPMD
jgi:tRNA A37 threonylcarbamoyladenosine biosynthesis protein TsaE